jgi:general secretion pathway protein D
MGWGDSLRAVVLVARRWAYAFCALLLVACLSSASTAQLRPQPVPAVLSAIKLISENADESRFQFSFDPKVTTFAPMATQQPTLPSMGFALTNRGPGAVQPSNLKGLVRTLSFEPVDTLLIVRFGTNRPAALSAVQTSDRTVEITISSGKAPKLDNDMAEAPTSGLPPAYSPPENFEMVMLKYADVSEVVGLLTDGLTVKSNDVFIPSEPQFGSNSLTGNSYTPPTTVSQAPGASDEPLGQSIDASIGIDRRLNAVWLRGPPDRIAQMKAMIAAIDIPVDSVVLETQFVELTEQGLKAIGIDFNNANGQIGVVTLQSGQFITPGVPAGAHLSSAQFQVALYAQIQKGNGRIVSRPRISAQSGSTAKIITGDALPILTSIALSGVNGVSQQVQYVNVGVTLQIAPRVSSDGWVQSHVFAVVSSVTGTSQGYPTISQREAETSATVRDGDSFVIGGLTQDETISSKSKVPVLGDIPIVGEAFRNERTTRSKTELYIIVTPHIVHRVGTRTEVAPSNAAVYAPTTTTSIPIVPDPPQRQPENR